MALVYGSEPSTAYYYFTPKTMASGSSQNSKLSSQSSPSAPSSSPPIPIPQKKTDLKHLLPTPLASHETEPKTPDLRQGPVDHTLGHQFPPTPGDAPPEKPKRMPSPSFVFDRAEAILESIKSSSNTREGLKLLTEETFVRLRAAIDGDTPLPFEVEPEAFEEWSQNLSDLGGYEYDPTRKELKILTLPGVIHERVTQVFNKWFGKVQETFQQEDRMHFTHNEDYTFENGSSLTPDGYISVETDGPIVAIEVGVSQPFDKQVEKAEKWLLKGPARLVILVDINITTLGKGEFSSSFTSSTSSTLGSEEALPYGITKRDLESLKVKEIASKIYHWYNDKTALAKLMHVSLYLYRHKQGNPKAINQDAKFVIFEESSGFKNLGSSEGFVTTNDLDIPIGNKNENIALPFDLLQACFGPALKKEQIRIAEKKAREILILHGHEQDNSSFQPSSGAGEVHSQLQDAGLHGDVLDRPQTRQERKRKLSSAVDVESDLDSSFGPTQSFQTTSSGVFQMDPPVPSDAPQFSQRSSPIPPVDSQVPKASLGSFSSAVGAESSSSQLPPKRPKRKRKA